MTIPTHLHERPARAYARVTRAGEIPPPSYESALDSVHRVAKTRAGMVCGVVIVALAEFAPGGGVHGPLAALLAMAPAVVIAGLAFPLIAWRARRDAARLKIQYGVRRKG